MLLGFPADKPLQLPSAGILAAFQQRTKAQLLLALRSSQDTSY